MLSPEQVNQYRKQYDIQPVTPGSSSGMSAQDRISQLKSGTYGNTPTLPPHVDQPAEQVYPEKGIAASIGDAASGYGHKLADSYSSAIPRFLEAAGSSKRENPLLNAAEGGLRATASGLDTVFAPITDAVSATADAAADNSTVRSIAGNHVIGKVLDLFGGARDKADEWASKHPEAAKDLNAGMNVALAVAGGKAGADVPTVGGAVSKASEIASDVSSVAKKGLESVKEKASGISESLADKRLAGEAEKIQETISPKLNAKETHAAMNEGRVTRGKDSALFGKQPDTVAPSERVRRYTDTIQQNIPGAAKMNDVELTKALNEHTSMLANNLGTDMKKVPLSDESASGATQKWSEIKLKQSEAPEFLDNESGNKAFQGKFENYLKQAQDGKTLDDVWEARKSYDDSIPANVKSASENSSPAYQTRKAMWLQNRELLNKIINDTASGLGEKSRLTFSKMSDMYGAKQNILSKAKIDTEGASNGKKIGGFMKKHPIITGTAVYGAEKMIKDLTGLGI